VFRFSFSRLQLNDLASSALILLIITALLHTTHIFSRVDNVIYDIGQRLIETPAPDDVVIIAIDQESLAQLGRWPWSRQVHADLLRRLKNEQAAAIGFDVIFAEPEQTNTSADAALAQAVAEANNVVFPVLLETVRSNGQIIETLPLPALMQHAADVGRVHAILDEDSIARGVFLYEGLGAPIWQTFAQATLNTAQNAESQNNFDAIVDGSKNQFQLARKDSRRINFLGPPGHFYRISYAQALNGEYPKDIFKNKILLVGATALGMNDLLTTPVSGLGQPMAGVEFHANLLESIRTQSLITQVPLLSSLVIVLLLSIAPLLWVPKLPGLRGFLSTILFMVLVGLLAGLLPKAFGIWIPPAAAMVSLLLAYPLWSWRKLEAAQRFLDFELNYLRQNIMSLPNQDEIKLIGFDKFDARIAQVRTASEQLHYLNQDRKETLAFISHDLRAPLANALMTLEQHQQLKEKLYQPLSQALHLAEDFLQASRAEMLDKKQFQEVDLTGLVHQTVDDAYEAASQKKMVIKRELSEDIVWVQGNFGLLHRAMLNLVTNAVKYGAPDTTVLIKLALNAEKTHVTFSVTDHGRGISAKEQADLFQRFSRIKGHEKMAEGAGLGLYFVRTVAEKHMGSVRVKSDLGKPTTFSFRLPVVDYLAHDA